MAEERNSTGPAPNGSTNHSHNPLWFRLASFFVGALILFVEIEVRKGTRIWVVGLALVLMGIVTLEQVVEWLEVRHRS